MSETIIESKVCTRCNLPKPLNEFGFKKKVTGLRNARCKQCIREQSKQHYKANKVEYVSTSTARRLEARSVNIEIDQQRRVSIRQEVLSEWHNPLKENSKTKGNATETAVLHKLIKLGKPVAIPYGENERYDLIVELRAGCFVTVQCKTGRYREGKVVFNTSSLYNTAKGTVVKNYIGQVDYFGIYCLELDKVFIVPTNMCRKSSTSLRIDPYQNKRYHSSVLYGNEYEI